MSYKSSYHKRTKRTKKITHNKRKLKVLKKSKKTSSKSFKIIKPNKKNTRKKKRTRKQVRKRKKLGKQLGGVIEILDYACDEFKSLSINQGDKGICWMASTLLMFVYSNIYLTETIQTFIFNTLRHFQESKASHCPLLPSELSVLFNSYQGYKIELNKLHKLPDDVKDIEIKTLPIDLELLNTELMDGNELLLYEYMMENQSDHALFQEIKEMHKMLIDELHDKIIQIKDQPEVYYKVVIEDKGIIIELFIIAILEASGYIIKKNIYNWKDVNSDILQTKINQFYSSIFDNTLLDNNKSLFQPDDPKLSEITVERNNTDDITKRIAFIDGQLTDGGYEFYDINKLNKLKEFVNSKKQAKIVKINFTQDLKESILVALDTWLKKIEFRSGIIQIESNSNINGHAMTLIKCNTGTILYCNSWGTGCKSLLHIYKDKNLLEVLLNFYIYSIIFVLVPTHNESFKLHDTTVFNRGILHQQILKQQPVP